MLEPNEKSDKLNIRNIVRTLVIAATIILISLIFPKYIYQDLQVGQAWTKSHVVAKKDISYKNNASEIEKQKKEYNLNLGLVFEYNSFDISSASKQVQEFVGFEDDLVENLNELIDQCYTIGVLPSELQDAKITVNNASEQKSYNSSELCYREEIYNAVRNFLSDNGYALNASTRRNIRNLLQPNLKRNDQLKKQLLENFTKEISGAGKTINKGDTIINQGDILSQSKYNLIKKNSSKFSLQSTGFNLVSFLGHLILVSIIIIILILYVRKYFNPVFKSTRKLTFILIWPVIFSYLVYAIENHTALSTYLIPFCIVPILVKNFFEDRLALIIHIVVILIASILSKLGYEFTFIQILAGMVTVLIVSETRFWDKFFLSIGFIFLTYVVGTLGLDLARWQSQNSIDFYTVGWLAANALLLLLAYPFIPLFENIFGFTSSIKLAELSDMNKALMKDLSMKAPGTLQHSLQVANLCEGAAKAIGANSLLVKTAALYHDIGKMENPQYFIENNSGTNPHVELNNNFESAKIIIGHVTKGIQLAKKNRLPQIIIDFIETHHGTTRVEYFYRNQLNDHPDKEFDELIFRYPGPLPTSKEQTIMMIADSIEAACKSLKNPAGSEIDGLIDKIIAHKIDEGQLEHSKLSFKELETCSEVFKTMMRSIHHVRVEYPDEPEKQTA